MCTIGVVAVQVYMDWHITTIIMGSSMGYMLDPIRCMPHCCIYVASSAACTTLSTSLSFTVQLYVPWNYHERYPGQYTWDGMADVLSFIELIQELDMIVLLRVGPYICAEWDFGGLPWWLGSSQVLPEALPQNCTLSRMMLL